MSPAGRGSFTPTARVGTAAELHGLELPDPLIRRIWVMEVARPALVLGSSQDAGIVDTAACAARGVDVTRRRSGGGLVLLQPGAQAWVDVLIPVDDPYWDDDVSRAFAWLAAAWQRALRGFGVETESFEGRFEAGRWGQLVCFAGRGPGELLVGGSKVVGMSMRRTREGARFQTMALCDWQPQQLAALLDPAVVDSAALLEGIRASGRALGQEPASLSAALIAALA